MATYLALLRGINVSGKNKILMADLRTALEKNNFKNIKTYIQSGNVIFETEKSKNIVAKLVSDSIYDAFNLKISVIILTKSKLSSVVKNNPFTKEKNIDIKKIYVTFLNKEPKDLSKFTAFNFDEDRYSFDKDILYLYCKNGAGKTKLTNRAIENKLSVTATTRNWQTTNKLLNLL